MSKINLLKEFVDNPQRKNRKDGNMYLHDGVVYSYGRHFPLMVHVGKYVLVNADRYSITTSRHQALANGSAGEKGVAIPFSAMQMAGIPMYRGVGLYTGERHDEFVKHLEILDVKQAHWEIRTRKDPKTGEIVQYDEHTLGASLFKWKDYSEKSKWKYFLSGTDATGKGRRGNYFLTELKRKAVSVDEAFEQMKPDIVHNAEIEGYETERQGEYFFIKMPVISEVIKLTDPNQVVKMKPAVLPDQSGKNGRRSSHVAREGILLKKDKITLVRGTVRHERGDHKMLKLGEDWWRVVHNVQVRSYNAGGGFD